MLDAQIDTPTVGNIFSENAKITARNVNVFYGDKQAIKDVSLDSGGGEVVSFIGQSCSGL